MSVRNHDFVRLIAFGVLLALGLLVAVLVGSAVTRGQPPKGAVGSAIAPFPADEPITVTTTGQRRFEGRIHSRSDDGRLVLQYQRDSILFLREFPWSAVSGVERAETTYTGSAFRQALAEHPHWRVVTAPSPSTPGTSIEIAPAPAGRQSHPSAGGSFVAAGRGRYSPPPSQLRVGWIEIQAETAQFDADAEPDGLRLRLRVFDRDGRRVSASGVLAVELHSLKGPPWHGSRSPAQTARWRETVTDDDFDALGSWFRLEFPSTFEPRSLAAHATVRAKLTVPGTGVFEAADRAVRIRPAYSAEPHHVLGRSR